MKERPIYFKNPLISKILTGDKTMTRRILKRVLKRGPVSEVQPSTTKGYDIQFRDREARWHDLRKQNLIERCPYGKINDILYVKESYRIAAWDPDTGEVKLDYFDKTQSPWLTVPDPNKFDDLWVAISNELHAKGIEPVADDNYDWPPNQSPLRWKTARFMPRWASRINLRITNIDVEPLHDISDADAILEGFENRDQFMSYWFDLYKNVDSVINWVISFERVNT